MSTPRLILAYLFIYAPEKPTTYYCQTKELNQDTQYYKKQYLAGSSLGRHQLSISLTTCNIHFSFVETTVLNTIWIDFGKLNQSNNLYLLQNNKLVSITSVLTLRSNLENLLYGFQSRKTPVSLACHVTLFS